MFRCLTMFRSYTGCHDGSVADLTEALEQFATSISHSDIVSICHCTVLLLSAEAEGGQTSEYSHCTREEGCEQIQEAGKCTVLKQRKLRCKHSGLFIEEDAVK